MMGSKKLRQKNLRYLYGRLERDILKDREKDAESVYNVMMEKISSKLGRLSNQYPLLKGVVKDLQNADMDKFFDLVGYYDSHFGIFSREVDIDYFFCSSGNSYCNNEDIFYKPQEKWIPSTRTEDRIIFPNPACEGRVRSWYGLVFITGSAGVEQYSKHLPSSGNKEASKFSGSLDLEEIYGIEGEVFNKGWGVLDVRNPEKRMFLLKDFSETVGQDKKGRDLNCVKLQADRTPANKRYKIRIHGYPVSEEEMKKEFL